MIRLRDVPGVQGIEDAERLNRAARVSNDHDLSRRIAEVSLKAFGIGPGDADFHYPEFALTKEWHELSSDEEGLLYAAMDEWEAHFDVCYTQDEQAAWSAMGWDVTGPDGEVLLCLPHFKRLMVCVSKGLRGRSVEAVATDAWAARLRPSGPPSVSLEQRARNAAFLSLSQRGRRRAS